MSVTKEVFYIKNSKAQEKNGGTNYELVKVLESVTKTLPNGIEVSAVSAEYAAIINITEGCFEGVDRGELIPWLGVNPRVSRSITGELVYETIPNSSVVKGDVYFIDPPADPDEGGEGEGEGEGVKKAKAKA